MTLQDVPRDESPTRAAPAAGFRAIVARLVHFARRGWLSWRLRRAAHRKDTAGADAHFATLHARAAGNPGETSRLAAAALRGARAAERRAKWLEASRLWTWYARASGDFHKAERNLVHCARSTTKTREDRAAV